MYSFSTKHGVIRNTMEPVSIWDKYRRLSVRKGWMNESPARVHPRIMFGAGCFLTEDFAYKNSITHVINCAEQLDSPSWFRETYPERYACIKAIDDVNVNILNWFTKFRHIMDDYLSDPECKVVYVHCQAGINRSGFLVLLYLCTKFKYSLENAIKTIHLQRPCALTNPIFQEQVYQYIKKHS